MGYGASTDPRAHRRGRAAQFQPIPAAAPAIADVCAIARRADWIIKLPVHILILSKPARGNLRWARRPAVAADFRTVHRRQAQKAERGEERKYCNKEKGEAEIADRQCPRTGDDRQQRGADRDAKAARELLRDTCDAGALAQIGSGHIGVADRIEAEILDAAQTAGG